MRHPARQQAEALPLLARLQILQLARDAGHEVVERKVGIEEWREGAESGEIREVFACGTAAVITPVGRLRDRETDVVVGGGRAGEVTMTLRDRLLDIQYGRADDTFGWMHRVC